MNSYAKPDFSIVDSEYIANLCTMTFKHVNRDSKKSDTFVKPKVNTEENQVQKLFFPMRVLLQILGRFPFSQYPVSKTASDLQQKPYSDSLLSFHWIYFAITSLICLVIFLAISLGFANVYLGWELHIFSNSSRFYKCEKAMFEENLVPFVLFWSCLLHSIVGNLSFFKNRKIIVNYLNQWESTIKTFEVTLSTSIRTYLIVANIWFLSILAAIVIVYQFKILRVAVGGADIIALLCLKPFVGEVVTSDPEVRHSWFSTISGIANFALVYSMYASRALLFLYAYKCRLLRFAFKQWNKRVDKLLSGNCYAPESKVVQVCENLYRDHILLITTVKQTDKIFGGILQAYYASQIVNMCFELYYLARSGTFKSSFESCNPEFDGEHEDEGRDIIAAVLLLVQNVSIFLQVSLDAAHVQDEAQKGYEVLRSKGVQLCFESRPKRYFVKTLMSSFSQKIVMTGGKFFSIDRPFVITVLGAVCTYFVIILQFGDRLLKSQ